MRVFPTGLNKNSRVVEILSNRDQKNNLSEARAVCGSSLLFFRDFDKIVRGFLCSLDFLVLFHQGKRTIPWRDPPRPD